MNKVYTHYEQHVVDVTVTDPFNLTNTRRVGSTSKRCTERNVRQYAERFGIVSSVQEKRKHKHYQRLVKANDAVFHTAGAFTTGELGKEFRWLMDWFSSIAQEELGGWDAAE